MILAGGEGKRLAPLTKTRCKPTVSFAGQYRLIDIPISNSLNAGINQIFVLFQHLPQELKEHISHMQTPKGHIELIGPAEGAFFEGNADSVRKSLGALDKADIDYFIILSSDQLYQMDLKEFMKQALMKEADLVVATKPVAIEEATRFGVMATDGAEKILDFIEKPSITRLQEFVKAEEKEVLVSMGIYLFKKEALVSLLKETGDDFGKDLIPIQIKKGSSFVFPYKGYWEDIGTISSYYHANLGLLRDRMRVRTDDNVNPLYTRVHQLISPLIHETIVTGSLISKGCIVKAKEISGSIIGLCSQIGEGSVIRNSILTGHHLPTSSIGKNCHIENSIIDDGVVIEDNVRLVNEKGIKELDCDGIFIRDGIIIVSQGTKVPANFVL